MGSFIGGITYHNCVIHNLIQRYQLHKNNWCREVVREIAILVLTNKLVSCVGCSTPNNNNRSQIQNNLWISWLCVFPFFFMVSRLTTKKYKSKIHKYSICQNFRKTQHVVYFWEEDCSRISSESRTVVQGLVLTHHLETIHKQNNHGKKPFVFSPLPIAHCCTKFLPNLCCKIQN